MAFLDRVEDFPSISSPFFEKLAEIKALPRDEFLDWERRLIMSDIQRSNLSFSRYASTNLESLHELTARFSDKEDTLVVLRNKQIERIDTFFLEDIIDLARPDIKKLDVGSGTGRRTVKYDTILGLHCGNFFSYYCDISDAMLEASRQRLFHAEGSKADVRSLPYRDGQFEIVSSLFGPLGYLELNDVSRAINELYRVTARGGRLYIDFPLWNSVSEEDLYGFAAVRTDQLNNMAHKRMLIARELGQHRLVYRILTFNEENRPGHVMIDGSHAFLKVYSNHAPRYHMITNGRVSTEEAEAPKGATYAYSSTYHFMPEEALTLLRAAGYEIRRAKEIGAEVQRVGSLRIEKHPDMLAVIAEKV